LRFARLAKVGNEAGMTPTTIKCPACDALTSRKGGHKIVKCGSCTHRWMMISEANQKSVEDTVYTMDYAGYRADPVFEHTVRLVLDKQIAVREPAPAEILDVGCGAGDFLAAATERGYRVAGIDVSEASAEICRSRGFEAVAADYLTYDFGRKFDIITMWDVIEHLRDPASFFMRTRELLNEGGIFFGKVPGFGDLSVSLSKHIPRMAGALLGAPSHLQYFNETSLEKLAARSGFQADWLPRIVDAMRAAPTGGSLKRRLGRNAARSITSVSGDRNIYFIAS